MKKTLAAVAVLGAFAGSALADVTVYGRLDTGLLFEDHEVTKNGVKETDATNFSMESGLSTTSRIGFKGSEKINDDLTVGFVLESKIMSDSGEGLDGFDREALVFLKTNYGSFYAGKVGSLWSDGGATNFWANYATFGTGSAVGTGTNFMVSQGRVANRLSYVSPEMAGFKLYAEYSFGADEHEEENTSGQDRPAAVGVNYKAGAFAAGAVVTYKNEASMVHTHDKFDDMEVRSLSNKIAQSQT